MKSRTTLLHATALVGVMALAVPAFAAGAGGAVGGAAGASAGGVGTSGGISGTTTGGINGSTTTGINGTAANGNLTGSGSSAAQMDANSQNNTNAALAQNNMTMPYSTTNSGYASGAANTNTTGGASVNSAGNLNSNLAGNTNGSLTTQPPAAQ